MEIKTSTDWCLHGEPDKTEWADQDNDAIVGIELPDPALAGFSFTK